MSVDRIDTSWMSQGACKVAPELFFPSEGELDYLNISRRAKEICHTCPVKPACLDYAITTNQQFGIWGETSAKDRRRMRRSRRQIAVAS